MTHPQQRLKIHLICQDFLIPVISWRTQRKTKHLSFQCFDKVSYKRACPVGHNKYRALDAEPNGIIPPHRRQWVRTGTVDSSIVRFLLPIGGGGSAEVALEDAFSYKKINSIDLEPPPSTRGVSKFDYVTIKGSDSPIYPLTSSPNLPWLKGCLPFDQKINGNVFGGKMPHIYPPIPDISMSRAP